MFSPKNETLGNEKIIKKWNKTVPYNIIIEFQIK